MSKHTPGPWKVVDDSFIRTIGNNPFHDGIIAEIRTWKTPLEFGRNYKKDASLIAAAPELLEACKLAANLPWISKEYAYVGEALEKAIEKAEGM